MTIEEAYFVIATFFAVLFFAAYYSVGLEKEKHKRKNRK